MKISIAPYSIIQFIQTVKAKFVSFDKKSSETENTGVYKRYTPVPM